MISIDKLKQAVSNTDANGLFILVFHLELPIQTVYQAMIYVKNANNEDGYVIFNASPLPDSKSPLWVVQSQKNNAFQLWSLVDILVLNEV